ncbi:T9SS type A sorting domain-containing protein [Hymenobacter gummosus]|uniref:T9SS type A sorting domain-containing protein n=1 Tax=Hymenobacter gummosus TaxID=1776032 RepID=A0A3S0H6K8_9BACT|nr:T9SS type A sorting domain-containing protein [Hymenobacter gummosus]RTQ46528.1 T9SS type A sorting domain-containing protein [Hymenobacter gummosus]
MKHALLLITGLALPLVAAAQTQQTTLDPAYQPLEVPATIPVPLRSHPLEMYNLDPDGASWVSMRIFLDGVGNPTSPRNIWLDRFSYNAAGQVTRVDHTDSLVAAPRTGRISAYSPDGRLTQVQMYYWTNGQPAPTVYPYSFAYDAHGNLTRDDEGGAVFDYQYTYDAAGVITACTKFRELSGQPRTPYQRITFTLQNGQWASSVQEQYDNGTWKRRRVVQRYSWHDWSRRQLRATQTMLVDDFNDFSFHRDTVRYLTNGTNRIVSTTTESLSGGVWIPRQYRDVEYNAQGQRVAGRVREPHQTQPGRWVYSAHDSTVYHHDAQGRTLNCTQYTRHRNATSALVLVNTFYFGPRLVTSTRAAARLPLRVYPNPARQQLHLAAPALSGSLTVEVLNGLGQLVERRRLSAPALAQPWDVSRWPAGVYTLRLRAAEGTATQRFVKE